MNFAIAPLPMLQTVPPVDPTASELLSPDSRSDHSGTMPSFCLHHQAICPVGAGRPHGWVEFLIRGTGAWLDLSPLELVRSGYYNHGAAFDLAVIESALQSGEQLHPSTRLGINIHPESLHDRAFVDAVLRRVLRRPGLARRVVLELVEFQGAVALESCRSALLRLRQYGLRIALDDFGPGFPNLDVMAAGLVDAVKLDRSLITSLDSAPRQLQLLSGLVELAERTGLELVAEGIETARQYERLRSIGVRWMQGYLFGRPGPIRHRSPTQINSACPSRPIPCTTQPNPKEFHA
jgi:EAL domain-containing protein (putative c-di-GMP-specific phosphodiesterase class I)